MNNYQTNKNMTDAIEGYLSRISENRSLKKMGLLDEHKRELRKLNFAYYEKANEYCNHKRLSVKDAEVFPLDYETCKRALIELHEAMGFVLFAESEL